MASRVRHQYRGAIQHVAVNGNNRQPVFLDDDDRRNCLRILGDTAARYRWDVWAYCLMDTHWHLVVHTPELTLSDGMRRLNSVYSRRFNLRHGRSGHTIRHSFMSVLVEDWEHRSELTQYLPLNPVRGGLVGHPQAWRWSSYRAEIGVAPAPPWLRSAWAAEVHGSPEDHRAYVTAALRRWRSEVVAAA